MKLRGQIWKDGKYWVVWIPTLDLSTQGKTKKDACEMLKDSVQMLLDDPKFVLQIELFSPNGFYLSALDSKRLFGMALLRNRSKLKLSYEEVRKLLDVKSRSEYRTYEQGTTDPTLSKLERLLSIIGLDIVVVPKDPKQEERLLANG